MSYDVAVMIMMPEVVSQKPEKVKKKSLPHVKKDLLWETSAALIPYIQPSEAEMSALEYNGALSLLVSPKDSSPRAI